MKRTTIPNPTRPGGLHQVEVTDRALRYRAQRNIEQSEKVCIYCGRSDRPLMVEHINGFEEDDEPANLAYACRPCNVKKGAHYARNGIGRRTRQYNPTRRKGRSSLGEGKGIRNLAQFIQAVQAVKGESAQMPLFEASELLRATPPDVRTRWAREANRRRWSRREAVPF